MPQRLFDSADPEPFPLSRSKLETFLRCARCFVLDRKCGVPQPSGPPYTLNNAVDTLLKREFDMYRAKGAPHPLMTLYGVEAVPLRHPMLESWRDMRAGVRCHHAATNFDVFGAVDDLWQAADGAVIVVDYKATSTAATVTLDGEWKDGYKRQAEVYQWLLRRNGLPVSDTAYFVYANADASRPAFDRKLEFSLQVLPYEGRDDWVDEALLEAHRALSMEGLPPAGAGCRFCGYRREARLIEP